MGGLIKSNPKFDDLYLNQDAFIFLITGGRGCFHSQTDIVTDLGVKKIKDINVFDKVLCYNELSNRDEFKSVSKLFIYNVDEDLIKVNLVNGKSIIATKDHKFYYGGRWESLSYFVSLWDERNMERNTEFQSVSSEQLRKGENYELEKFKENCSNEASKIKGRIFTHCNDKRSKHIQSNKGSSNGVFCISRSSGKVFNGKSYQSHQGRQQARESGMDDSLRELYGSAKRRITGYIKRGTNRKFYSYRKTSKRNKIKIYPENLREREISKRVWSESMHNKGCYTPSQLELGDIISYNFVNGIKQVYDISVADNHNYYLDCGKHILVHNSAKSFNVSTFLERLSFQAGHRILFSRYTMTSASISVIPEFLQKIELDGFANKFSVTKDEITNTFSKSVIMFKGIKTSSGNQTASLKSIQGLTTFCGDEMEEWQSEEDYDTLMLSIRQAGIKNRIILVMNPSNAEHFVYKKYIKDTHKIVTIDGVDVQISTHPQVCHIHTTYLDNLEHLSKDFIDGIELLKKTDLKKYGFKIIGRWQDRDEENALWKQSIINATRAKEAPRFKRIVVSIDPAVTSKDTSDETGLVVVGLGFDDEVYPLEDCTGTYTPTEWCQKSVDLYNKWKADRVVGEVNNGGDLIEALLRTIAPNLPYSGVHATRDKLTRAEPVAALYEQGKGHHVGVLLELEYEMTTWAAKKGDKSPNRIDALVWAVAELLPEIGVNPVNRMGGSFGAAMRSGR